MMKSDTQHLDYLISQYVDGCLDPSSRKSLEQKLVNDPVSRQLYREQREVQDVLDDWGSRIPMIDWADFDKKLAGRLEHEVVGGEKVSVFRRLARPMAAAAALFIAGAVVYGWHAWSTTTPAQIAVLPAVQQNQPASVPVSVEGMNQAVAGSSSTVVVQLPGETIGNQKGAVAISPPGNGASGKPPTGTAMNDLKSLPPILQQNPSAGAVTAMGSGGTVKEKDDREPGPGFP
jgi:anti-sigma factor RsiW